MGERRGVLPLLLGAVLAVFTGQQLLNPVLAPLSRELGLSCVLYVAACALLGRPARPAGVEVPVGE